MKTLLIAAFLLVLLFVPEGSEGLCAPGVKVSGLEECCDTDEGLCSEIIQKHPDGCKEAFIRMRCCGSCYGESSDYFKHGFGASRMIEDKDQLECIEDAKVTGLDECCDEDADACAGMVGAAPDDCNAANNRKFCCASCYNEDKDYFRQDGQNYVLQEDKRYKWRCIVAKVNGMECCDSDSTYCSGILNFSPDDCEDIGTQIDCCASCHEYNPNNLKKRGKQEGDRKRQVSIKTLLKYLLQRKK